MYFLKIQHLESRNGRINPPKAPKVLFLFLHLKYIIALTVVGKYLYLERGLPLARSHMKRQTEKKKCYVNYSCKLTNAFKAHLMIFWTTATRQHDWGPSSLHLVSQTINHSLTLRLQGLKNTFQKQLCQRQLPVCQPHDLYTRTLEKYFPKQLIWSVRCALGWRPGLSDDIQGRDAPLTASPSPGLRELPAEPSKSPVDHLSPTWTFQ